MADDLSGAVLSLIMGDNARRDRAARDAFLVRERRQERERETLQQLAETGDSKLFEQGVAAFVNTVNPSEVDFFRALAKRRASERRRADTVDLTTDLVRRAESLPPGISPERGGPAPALDAVVEALRIAETRTQGRPSGRQVLPAGEGDPSVPTPTLEQLPFVPVSQETQDTFSAIDRTTRAQRREAVKDRTELVFKQATEGRQLSTAFVRESKTFLSSRNSLAQLRAIAKEPPSNIRDASIRFFYARLLNPIGVLSDQDIERTIQETLGQALSNAFSRSLSGQGTLTGPQVRQILGVAASVHKEQRANQVFRTENFANRAKQIGLDPNSVVGSVRLLDAARGARGRIPAPQNAQFPSGQQGGVPNAPAGFPGAVFEGFRKSDGAPVFVLDDGQRIADVPDAPAGGN